jgi:hypothetical protein
MKNEILQSLAIMAIVLITCGGVSASWRDLPADSLIIHQISRAGVPGMALHLAVEGNYCYIAAHDSGLQIVDISEIESPYVIGGLSGLGRTNRIKIRDNYAYVASYDSGFQIVDVSDRTCPQRISRVLTEVQDAIIEGEYAYIVDQFAFHIYNISNPVKPESIAYLPEFYYSTTIAIKGKYAYALHCYYRKEYCDIKIVDIADPNKPFIATKYDTLTDYATLRFWDRIVIKDNFLYGAGSNTSLDIIDISNPIFPKPVKQVYTSENPHDFYIKDNDIFMIEDYGFFTGIKVVDITNPGKLRTIAFYDTNYWPEGIIVRGELIFIASRDSGLVILEYTR